jgi:hypothetical protein
MGENRARGKTFQGATEAQQDGWDNLWGGILYSRRIETAGPGFELGHSLVLLPDEDWKQTQDPVSESEPGAPSALGKFRKAEKFRD